MVDEQKAKNLSNRRSWNTTKTTNEEKKVDPSNPDTIPKFVDELPIPAVLSPKGRAARATYYEVEMKEAFHKFHDAFPLTRIWGYEGMYPGPTIEAFRNRPVCVKWMNKLPTSHFLPLDHTLHGVIDTSEVRTTVHLHGANVSPESDGHPDSWYTRDYEVRGKSFKKPIYRYKNNQQAATLWYHDHAVGITRLNVYAGLLGMYIIRDTLEPRLELPCGDYEIPVIIQDKSFNSDGSLFYPSDPPFPVAVSPSVVPAFIGNTIVVNGKVWPHLKVEPRKYRFRLLNASNTRTYVLRLSNDLPFYQIGSDGGLLGSPVQLDTLTLAPAERADIIIDFSKSRRRNIVLMNDDVDPNTSVVMQFRIVLPLKSRDTSKIPEVLYPVHPIKKELAEVDRYININGETDQYGRPMLLLENRMWQEPILEKPQLNTIEIWNFVNLTDFMHPIHVHLVQFQVLDRIPFDVDEYKATGEIVYTGDAIEPDDNEKGWKDVVRANAGEITRIIAHFNDFPGDYVLHCHILEHEDHDMMRPFKVMENK